MISGFNVALSLCRPMCRGVVLSRNTEAGSSSLVSFLSYFPFCFSLETFSPRLLDAPWVVGSHSALHSGERMNLI